MDKKNTPSLRTEALEKINQKHSGNETEIQMLRTLAGLQTFGSLTTQDIRQDLDIMHPAGRIKELRDRNYDIRLFWERYPTTHGKMHRMARYVYMGKMGGAV
ncbi:MAG: helix-turn-helix domain-containing protein [Undibacterium umbellatum]|uniref:helix-turn-helix domain-containing protein n=1 Tax=Undibacterium umbellatum TaxID=2762300 RepID=UPI003BB66975